MVLLLIFEERTKRHTIIKTFIATQEIYDIKGWMFSAHSTVYQHLFVKHVPIGFIRTKQNDYLAGGNITLLLITVIPVVGFHLSCGFIGALAQVETAEIFKIICKSSGLHLNKIPFQIGRYK